MVLMLRIYEVMIGVLRELRPILVQIEARDGDLARQLRRAASSVALNIAEGSGSSGGTRRERYRNALGSAREVSACLDTAEALGYTEVVCDPLKFAIRHVQGALVRVTT